MSARPVRGRTMVLAGVGALAVFLILLTVGVVPRLRNSRELAGAAEQLRTTPLNVYVVRPERASVAGLTLAATTQAIQDSVIYARISGYLIRRYVDIGDRVTAGQLLAEVDSPEVDEQLRQARAELQQTEKALDLQRANLDLARATMARYEAADAEGAVAKQAVDQSVAMFRTAQASVAAAEANVMAYKANVQRLLALTSFQRVVAPFAGTVIQRNVDVGALITAGSPVNNIAAAPTTVTGAASGLFEVAQIDTLRVFVNVPQAYAKNVEVGMPVQVRIRGELMEPVKATVTRTASAIDTGTRTLLTQVDIPNPSHRMLPGSFVYVDFQIGPAGTHWRIPASALVFNAQGTRVILVRAGNKLHFQNVVVGRDLGTAIDVQSGLDGNETVVKLPTVSLQEGQIVNPIAAPATNGG
jgi:multidrug efflux pump subunit AcrA (membrane-fusion protein)